MFLCGLLCDPGIQARKQNHKSVEDAERHVMLGRTWGVRIQHRRDIGINNTAQLPELSAFGRAPARTNRMTIGKLGPGRLTVIRAWCLEFEYRQVFEILVPQARMSR